MPDRNLNLALIPINISSGDIGCNISRIDSRIRSLNKPADLVVLPELCFTGFTNDRSRLEALAESNSGHCIKSVMQWSQEFDIAIIGGFLAHDSNGNLYNRGFMIRPDAEPQFYDKRHLFCQGGESKLFKNGQQMSPTVEFRSWKLKMAICYDIRFPVWNRNIGLEYDALIVPANWPSSRYHAWRHMLIARAIENQAYVAGCDREGADEYGEYNRFDSMVIDHSGYDISQKADDGTIYATLDAEKLNKSRHKFTPYKDADKFTLTID